MARSQLGVLPATPAASAPGDVTSAGTAGDPPAQASHKHAREAWGLAADLTAASDTAVAGASGRTADAAHGHLLSLATLRDRYLRPSTTLAETLPIYQCYGTNGAPTSGQLMLYAIALPTNLTIGHLGFLIAAAASGPTHWWFGLFDSNRVALAFTADQTSTACGAAVQSLAIATIASGASSTFTTTYTGLYYIGFMMTASTTVAGIGFSSVGTIQGAIGGLATPVLAGACDTSKTTVPTFPFTAAAFAYNSATSTKNLPYAIVAS